MAAVDCGNCGHVGIHGRIFREEGRYWCQGCDDCDRELAGLTVDEADPRFADVDCPACGTRIHVAPTGWAPSLPRVLEMEVLDKILGAVGEDGSRLVVQGDRSSFTCPECETEHRVPAPDRAAETVGAFGR